MVHQKFRRPLKCALPLLLACGIALPASSGPQDTGPAKMAGLDDQVQEIKSDVLAIAAELEQLEEKLLYPSGTQVSVFVSIDPDQRLDLESLELRFNGDPVARHVYSFRELEALRKGGVQRLFTGNLPVGEHRVEVVAQGTLPSGGRFDAKQTLAFDKQPRPAALGVGLADAPASGGAVRLEPL